jgi:eukaryotic translation initiation factor 2C
VLLQQRYPLSPSFSSDPHLSLSLIFLFLSQGQLTTKISIVVCQKRHKTRLVYEESPGHYINVCPGVCVDSSGGGQSIASANFIEFYLNSHTAIQGTAKACKYSLLYDEIGLTVSELELLTYWLCYLYSRCNRSVSLATPAYYAHWASKRARNLLSGGASDGELTNISRTWCLPNRHSTMFFI